MALEEILFLVGGVPVTYGRLFAGLGVLGLVLLLIILIFAWRGARARTALSLEANQRTSDLEYRLAELSGSLSAFAEQVAHHDAHLARTLDERLDQVSVRLGQGLSETAERTTQSLQSLNERLAVIDNAQRNITELSTHMVSLKDILSNKQTRGAFGQGRMEAIIRDGLHQSAYSFQCTLSNGTRPDCLIKLPESELGLIIDAKFPLEAYNLLKAARADAELRQAESRLRSDVLKHVKDIAQKYLIAGETH